jgi:hypothetical protein
MQVHTAGLYFFFPPPAICLFYCLTYELSALSQELLFDLWEKIS